MNKLVITGSFVLAAMFFALTATAQDKAGIFSGTDYAGPVAAEVPVGEYGYANNLKDAGLAHDMTVQSIKVPNYLRVILYEHENFRGQAAGYGAEDLNSINVPGLSSLKVVNQFPSETEVKALVGKTWSGNWDWAHDDSDADKKTHDPEGRSKVTLTSEGEINYIYNGQNMGDFSTKLGHGGGDKRQPMCANITLKDGNELRFEWVTPNTVSAYFWKKGNKAGQKKNNTPETRAILTMSR